MIALPKKDPLLVNDYRLLTVDWAQSVLRLHDVDAVVHAVEVVALHIGTTTRVQLAVDHDSQDLARRWFVKLPSRKWQARVITALPRLLQTEARFYQQIAKRVPLNMPVCLAARTQWGRGTILVLADLTELGGRVGNSGDALGARQAYSAVEQLAQFHAGFWQDSALKHNYPWIADSVRYLEDLLGSALAVPLMRRGLKKAGDLIPAALHKPALTYAKNRKKVMAFLNDAPLTLTHHDCHPGNLFWLEDGTAGFLDWQLVRCGEGIGDISYLLTTALTPEVRRRHEDDLLAHYAKILSSHGIAAPGGNVMTRYRAHCCYAFEAMVITLAIGGMMDLNTNLELIRRASIVLDDLDCFAALPLTQD